MILKSIFRMMAYSSAHVQRAEGSNRWKFSHSAGGWYCFAVSGSSKTEGCVAMAVLSKVLPRCHQKRFSSDGTPNSEFWSAKRCVLTVWLFSFANLVGSSFVDESLEIGDWSTTPLGPGCLPSGRCRARAVDILFCVWVWL